MKIILGERQSGKTANIIMLAAQDKKNGVYSLIVCPNQRGVDYTQDLARRMGREIAMPITFGEFMDSKGRHPDTKYYLDNLDVILSLLAKRAGIEVNNILGVSMFVNQSDEYATILEKEKDQLITLGVKVEVIWNTPL